MGEVLLILESNFGSLINSLIFLTIAIKALVFPLSQWAHRGVANHQELVKEIEPEIRQIRSSYKGEEQSERILALYKKHSLNPFASLKVTLVLLIQIPIFIGVYSSVSNDARFQGEAFGPVSDVTKGDSLISVGDVYINFLPILMLVVSVANLLVMRRMRDMQKSQEITGWIIAFGFFFLLYSSAAALVIYWTTNILLQWFTDWILLRLKK